MREIIIEADVDEYITEEIKNLEKLSEEQILENERRWGEFIFSRDRVAERCKMERNPKKAAFRSCMLEWNNVAVDQLLQFIYHFLRSKSSERNS